jgi:hypothetical protein
MVRLFLTYLLPLLLPVLGYLAWNWLRNVAGKRAEPPPDFADMPWMVLAGAGISLLVVTLLALVFLDDGGSPGETYIPPHLEDGKLIPGRMR